MSDIHHSSLVRSFARSHAWIVEKNNFIKTDRRLSHACQTMANFRLIAAMPFIVNEWIMIFFEDHFIRFTNCRLRYIITRCFFYAIFEYFNLIKRSAKKKRILITKSNVGELNNLHFLLTFLWFRVNDPPAIAFMRNTL